MFRSRHKTAAVLLAIAVTMSLALPAASFAAGNGNGHGNGNKSQKDIWSGAKVSGCTNTHTGNKSGNGANKSGPYDSTCDGSPSGNGNGGGNANGRPCAGCVGNADDKNPPGQVNNTKDNGYECDGNSGIGRTNPAHTGCKTTPATTAVPGQTTTTTPGRTTTTLPGQTTTTLPGATTTTVPGQTTTTLPGQTTTTVPGQTTTTLPGQTTTTAPEEVLGVQITTPNAKPNGPVVEVLGVSLARTGINTLIAVAVAGALVLSGLASMGVAKYRRNRVEA